MISVEQELVSDQCFCLTLILDWLLPSWVEIIKQDQPEDLSPACHAPDSDKKTGDPTVQVVESEEASDRLETGLDGTIDPANVKIAFWWSTFIVLIVSVVVSFISRFSFLFLRREL